MRIIGLTGLIGTGKSTVAGLLRRLECPVHDADGCVHALYRDERVQAELLKAFPGAQNHMDGTLDRNALMDSLKGHPERKATLEAIIHPLVLADQMAFLLRHRRKKAVVLDVPLLFETGTDALCDQVWVTHCRAALQKNRVLRRPGFDEAKLKTILGWQGSGRDKRKAANLVLNTGASRARLLQTIKKALRSKHARNRS